MKGLRAANAENKVVNVTFQTQLPDGVTIEQLAEAIQTHVLAPLELPDGSLVYDWTEGLNIFRSRSTR